MNEERLYINGNQIDLPIGQSIPKTLQVNDIGSIADRQSNFTRTINIPKNPNNVKALDFLDVIGNDSNVPYQRNEVNYFVGNECLIYNGWANVSESSDSYKVNIYDGIVDFYKAIENKFITDVGISSLNHSKTVGNVIASWTGNTSYRYMVADYNGKKTFVPSGTTEEIINIDYLIPAANVKFIWDKIFDYFGFEYEGNIFNSTSFTNLWLSYPKPIPTLVPSKILVNQQTFNPLQYTYSYYSGYALLTSTQWFPWLFNTPFVSSYAKVVDAGTTTTSLGDVIPNVSKIDILQNGTYAIDLSGISSTSTVNYIQKRGGVLFESGVLIPNINNDGLTKNLPCLSGDTLSFMLASEDADFPFIQRFSKIDGFEVNFEDVFIDFKVKDFVNEILQRFSLTMFPDKYEKKLTFLTTEEWLQTNDLINWSNKNPNLVKTTYTLNGYSQKNRFKYKYNDEDSQYNDGLISIDNVNIDDEKTVIQSRIYTPERLPEPMLDFSSNVYKFWNKEVKDDGTINYKPLENRFYLLRSIDHTFNSPTKIGSESLNTTATVTFCKKESYSRLRFQEIISDYYEPIGSILNKSKIFHVDLNLSTNDVNDFDFRKLIYIDQFGSYFLVNKISNYVQNKLTRCELIKVDYQATLTNEIPIIIPPDPTEIATYLEITNVVVDGCQITLEYSTDAPAGTEILLSVQPNTFGIPVIVPIEGIYLYAENIYNTGTTNSVTFTLEAGTLYQVQLSILGGTPTIYSNVSYFENSTSCVASSPSILTVTNVDLLSTSAFSNTYKIDFTTNAVLPRTVYFASYTTPVPIDPSNPLLGSFGGWSIDTSVAATTNSINAEISTFFGIPQKVRIKIGTTVSNEFNI